jgi:hypothetical protein
MARDNPRYLMMVSRVKNRACVIITMIQQMRLLMANCTPVAVYGITVAEDATPTAAQIAARKQLAPNGWHVSVMRNGRH